MAPKAVTWEFVKEFAGELEEEFAGELVGEFVGELVGALLDGVLVGRVLGEFMGELRREFIVELAEILSRLEIALVSEEISPKFSKGEGRIGFSGEVNSASSKESSLGITTGLSTRAEETIGAELATA